MRTPLSLLAVVLLNACQGPEQAGSARAAEPDPLPAPAVGAADPGAEALIAIRAGDYRTARAHLARALSQQLSVQAGRLEQDGQALEALVLLDEALELQPGDAELLYQRGAAALAAAPSSSQPQFLYEDALDHLQLALRRGAPVKAYFDASRAARRIPQPELALELARKGGSLLRDPSSAGTLPASFEPLPERTWAEAAFDVYLAKLNGGEDPSEHFSETEGQLTRLLGQTPEDSWPRLQLANLYQWAGDPARAFEQLTFALEIAPDDTEIHSRIQQLGATQLGYPDLARWYREFASSRPPAAVMRNTGVACFNAALLEFEQGETNPEPFIEAQGWFRRAREADGAWSQDCLGYEAVTRNAIGWCHFNAKDLGAARQAFLSMEDLFEGALAWSLSGRLPDGVAGLSFVVRTLAADPNNLESRDQLVEAAEISDYLHAYRPEDGNLANDAGFVNRDAAVLVELSARTLRHQAEREQGAQREASLAEAERLGRLADELMGRSWAAYQVAARLLPEDVRVVNDAGLVMAYYLRTDPEAAERYLLSAIEHGSTQILAEGLDEAVFEALNEAWGDAHQNMAILELTLRGNGQAARLWLEKSLEIGPATREGLRGLLEDCDRMTAGEEVDLARTLIGRMVWLDHPRR